MELIDKNALIELIEAREGFSIDQLISFGNRICQYIKDAPVVDNQSKGNWFPRLHASENDIFVCSCCKREIGYTPKFCPNCGKEMEPYEW